MNHTTNTRGTSLINIYAGIINLYRQLQKIEEEHYIKKTLPFDVSLSAGSLNHRNFYGL